MDTSKLSNTIVRSAIEAWQKGESQTFLSCFVSDAKLFDDGSPHDLQQFTKEHVGMKDLPALIKWKIMDWIFMENFILKVGATLKLILNSN
jgi:hypothetical protein